MYMTLSKLNLEMNNTLRKNMKGCMYLRIYLRRLTLRQRDLLWPLEFGKRTYIPIHTCIHTYTHTHTHKHTHTYIYIYIYIRARTGFHWPRLPVSYSDLIGDNVTSKSKKEINSLSLLI